MIKTMTDYGNRETWLASRASGIGASEVSALFGLSPWDSAFSLWAKKTGQGPAVDAESEEAEYLYWGQHLETAIAGRYELVTKRSIWTGGSSFCVAQHPDLPMFRATPDKIVLDARDIGFDEPGPLQIKNTAWFMAQAWEDGPPPHVEIQVQSEMACTRTKWASVAALVGGNKFRYFDIPAKPEVIAEIEAQVVEFWQLVEARRPPPADGHKATTRILKALHPMDDGSTVDLPAEATSEVDRWLAAKEEIAAAKRAFEPGKDEAENVLRALIGPATYGRLPDGRVLTLKHTTRASYVVDETTYRQLRIESASARKKRGG